MGNATDVSVVAVLVPLLSATVMLNRSVACRKAADTLISDAAADNVRSRLPTWLQREAGARSFVLLPMTMKSAPFALIYADAASAGGIVLGDRELSLLRTLRNQAVMAFKTAA